MTILIDAINNNDVEAVKQIAKYADINEQGKYGFTPLLSALCDWIALCNSDSRKRSKIIKFLIKKGADVNATTDSGNTPLIFSVGINNIKISKLLLNNGAKIDTQNNWGETTLIKTATWDNIKMVKFLVTSGATLNVVDKNSNTAFSVAVKYNYFKIAKLLKNHELLNKSGAQRRTKS